MSPDCKSPWNSTSFLLSMIPPLRMSTYLGVSLVDLCSFLSIIKHARNPYNSKLLYYNNSSRVRASAAVIDEHKTRLQSNCREIDAIKKTPKRQNRDSISAESSANQLSTRIYELSKSWIARQSACPAVLAEHNTRVESNCREMNAIKKTPKRQENIDSISVCRIYHAQSSFPHCPTNS